jgi:hypothetical protein
MKRLRLSALLALSLLAPLGGLLLPSSPRKTFVARIILKDSFDDLHYREKEKRTAWSPFPAPWTQERLTEVVRGVPGGERATLEFDPREPHRFFVLLRGEDDRRLAGKADSLYRALYRPVNRVLKEEFGEDYCVSRYNYGMTVLAEESEEPLPGRLRLALSLWLLSLSALLGGYLLLPRRRPSLPLSLVVPPPRPAPEGQLDGLQDFPPSPPAPLPVDASGSEE